MRRRSRTTVATGPHDGTCWRCDRPIADYRTQAVRHHGKWIHRGCAPGGDDE